MSKKSEILKPSMRVLLCLDFDDDPLLYDDLNRFRQGTKRVNRLRQLAHDAVLGQIFRMQSAHRTHLDLGPPTRSDEVQAGEGGRFGGPDFMEEQP